MDVISLEPLITAGFWACIGVSCLIIVAHACSRLRTPVSATVNCWFCNTNTRVQYRLKDTWTCPTCQQYNGFDSEGDYNKLIPAQSMSILNRPGRGAPAAGYHPKRGSSNGLCYQCNLNQVLKVHQLASFEPLHERNYDVEIEAEEKRLSESYDLCDPCKRLVERTLRPREPAVPGSSRDNFLSFANLNIGSGMNIPRPVSFSQRPNYPPNPRHGSNISFSSYLCCTYHGSMQFPQNGRPFQRHLVHTTSSSTSFSLYYNRVPPPPPLPPKLFRSSELGRIFGGREPPLPPPTYCVTSSPTLAPYIRYGLFYDVSRAAENSVMYRDPHTPNVRFRSANNRQEPTSRRGGSAPPSRR